MDIKCNINRLFTYTLINTNGSASATTFVGATIGSQHTTVKEEVRQGGRYNRAVRGYFNASLPNGNICLGRSLCLYNGFTITFNRITYKCKLIGRDYFALHKKTSFATVHTFVLVIVYLFGFFFFTIINTQSSSSLQL